MSRKDFNEFFCFCLRLIIHWIIKSSQVYAWLAFFAVYPYFIHYANLVRLTFLCMSQLNSDQLWIILILRNDKRQGQAILFWFFVSLWTDSEYLGHFRYDKLSHYSGIVLRYFQEHHPLSTKVLFSCIWPNQLILRNERLFLFIKESFSAFLQIFCKFSMNPILPIITVLFWVQLFSFFIKKVLYYGHNRYRIGKNYNHFEKK